ncbi:SdpI family protein [Arthrobacter sp. NPDC055585]
MNALVQGSFGLFLLAAVLGTVARFIGAGQLSRNQAIGIRTRATMTSDEAWTRGHEAALPWMRTAALGALAAGLACAGVGIAVTGEPDNVLTGVLTLGGYALVTGLIITAGVAANRAALKA